MTLETDFLAALQRWEKSDEFVFICRSGGRSAEATRLALAAGFRFVANMKGSMLAWQAQQLPVEYEK